MTLKTLSSLRNPCSRPNSMCLPAIFLCLVKFVIGIRRTSIFSGKSQILSLSNTFWSPCSSWHLVRICNGLLCIIISCVLSVAPYPAETANTTWPVTTSFLTWVFPKVYQHFFHTVGAYYILEKKGKKKKQTLQS